MKTNFYYRIIFFDLLLLRLKLKIYRSVVRPIALYGFEKWPTMKDNERRLSVMETKMLCWTSWTFEMRIFVIDMGLH